ncbi:protein of unknown function [Taphrina deformans PYCC 5710]|uniref:Uncharacterized protein n=1 Tax=Taphrina deformans (strain PYCC 5710 / ATCC 11124 / CBS 356.35 / IMI 108563 / JCM 9778 / NBRC 8474) TaxID=1097556 RepID=R4XG88_TAPDE|nr:protein of unknown function [Taphrina deformans PYCC 5710]|eukprot:CCG82399.1 protein of unknown function [Taphrina deformans PYCC 5710]
MFFDRFFTPKEEDIHASNSSTPTSTSSQTTPRPTGHLASRPQSYHQTLPAPCACKSIYAKTESRLLGKVSDLEAERDTKDLTISILSEQLLDKSQEIELLRMKLAGLERALAGDLDGPLYSPPFDPPFESVLSGGRAGDSAIGSSAGSQGVTSPPRSTTGTTVPTFDGDVSYEELVDENVALRDEVARLSHVLEDGLGALAGLEI